LEKATPCPQGFCERRAKHFRIVVAGKSKGQGNRDSAIMLSHPANNLSGILLIAFNKRYLTQ
jgi:hypothetical protein